MLSATAETCHDPIGPCGPLEQSEDSLTHSTMADWSSDLDFGAHPVVGRCYNGYIVAARVIVRVIWVRLSIGFRLRISVRSKRLRGGIDINQSTIRVSDI